MVIVQVRISAPGNDKNRIEVDLLEREDANDAEREAARSIQDMHQAAFEYLREQLGADQVHVSVIERAAPAPSLGICPRCDRELDNVERGVSVVAGGQSVCTPCVNPGEIEIARARGL